MTTSQITEVIPSWFNEFRDQIKTGLADASAAYAAAASLYVEGINKNPEFREFMMNEFPQVSGVIWRSLEKVGRGQLDSRIAVGSVPYGNKLRRLSLSDQKKAIDQTIPMLLSNNDTLQVKIDSITNKQAEQLFANDHIRDLSEQRAWIESTISKSKSIISAKNIDNKISIDKKKQCIIVNGICLSISDLADYIRKLSN